MAENPDFPRHDDPRLEQAIADLAKAESGRPDELTRRRHLVAMGKARTGRRTMTGVSAAAAAIALIVGAVSVSNNGGISGNGRTRNAAAGELPPLKEDPQLSPVPFVRSENYVILRVDSDRVKSVATQLSTALGSDAAVVGRTSKATTFVVPESAAQAITDTTGISAVADTKMKMTAQQTNPPSWGLDRLDSASLDNSYGYISPGAGEYVYVIDTGIYAHSDFGGRVRSGFDAVNDGNGTVDCNGHGTHVAGTVAGSNYGVAKSATVVAVRVLDCTGSGYASSVVAGINWVIASHPGGAGVINMSLGGGANSAVDQAVADATAAGLMVVVAAGNSGADACSYSPARAPSAITVGAIDRTSSKASYSNYGSCVDIWAPGSQITSDYIGGGTATMSGTSMASPHIAGMAARLLQARPGISAASITSTLSANSLSTDPAGLPMVEFAETPDYATPTTTIEPVVTTTTGPGTTTTVDPATTTTLPGGTTTVPGVTTTVPGATTTTTVAPPKTTVPKNTPPKNTVPRKKDDDDETPSPTTPPVKVAPQPKEFSLRFGEDANRSTMYATWEDNDTPDSWKIECSAMVGGTNAPVDTTIDLPKDSVINVEKGRHKASLSVVPAAGSRCWISSIVGSVTSSRSNAAIVPPKRAPATVPPTTTTIPPTTTTVAPTTTTTVPPTTVPPTTTTTVPETTTTVVVAGRVTPKPTTTVKKPTRKNVNED